MYMGDELRKFDIVYCNLGKPSIDKGSIQCNSRFCIVVSNDKCCRYSPILQIVPLTKSRDKDKAKIPTHMEIEPLYGLKEKSIILNEQILTVNKISIQKKCGHISDQKIQEEINNKLRIQLAL